MAENKKNQKPSAKSATNISENSTSTWVFLAPVLILTFVLYSGSLKNYFIINWDDDGYIINNPLIKDFSWKSIVFMFSHFHLDNYHPLTTLSNAIEYHLFKLNPKPYHFNNLVLHLLNTTLVFYFIKQLIKNKEAAALAALLFAIHPMHVESVSWISERKDLLYTAFFLLALITYNRFLLEEKKNLLVLSMVFMILSCLSKPAAVALTPLLFLMDYYSGKKITKNSIIQKIPFFIISLLFGVLALLTQSRSGSMNMVGHFPLVDKLFFVCYGLSFYLVKFFYPFHLAAMYLYPVKVNGFLPMEYYLAPLLILVMIISFFRFKKIQRELIFGFLFYFFTLAMVIQVVPVGKAIVAERYSYVPYIGLFFILAKLYVMVKNNKFESAQKIKPVMNIIIGICIVVFCFITWNRNKDWKDSNSLFTSIVKQQPESYYGYFARGVGRTLQNDPKGAIDDYSQAIKRDSIHDFLWYNRGVEFEKINEKTRAAADYTQAIKINPQHAKSFYNRGNLKFVSGDLAGAIQDYSQSLKIDSSNAEAFCNRAIVNLNLKDSTKALADFNASLKQNPKLVNALYNRASLYIAQNKLNAACEDYSAASKEGSVDAQKLYDYYCKQKN
jgi:protein O-mannosyl-transferase